MFKSPRITMTLLVRNEEDIIADNLRFHYKMGVDNFIIMDNKSTDRTLQILSSCSVEMPIEIIHQSSDDYDQSEWVTAMARKACKEYASDWIINNDADEFWVPQAGDLKEFLLTVPVGVTKVLVNRFNAIVHCEPHARLKGSCNPRNSYIFDKHSRNSLDEPLPGKMLHRASTLVVVGQGNHDVWGLDGDTLPASPKIKILHFPYRDLQHYERKIRLGGAAYERNPKIPTHVGATWRNAYSELQSVGLKGFWANLALTRQEVEIGLSMQRYFADRTVVAFFENQASMDHTISTARDALLESSKRQVDDFVKSAATIVDAVPRQERLNEPMYYNFEFAVRGPRAHIKALEELTTESSPVRICADLPKFRDAISLFPKNTAVKPFLRQAISFAQRAAVERFVMDIDQKRVLLHVSCAKNLRRTEHSITSFRNLGLDYVHVILIGQDVHIPEDEIELSFSYDGKFLRVPVPDSYENLHRKLFFAYFLFDLLTRPNLLVKLDDNVLLECPVRFTECLDSLTAQSAAVYGRRVGTKVHNDQWHGWHLGKCDDKRVEVRGYQYPMPRAYPAGGFGYALSGVGLAACSNMYLAMKEFFSMRAVGLEDVYVGHALDSYGYEVIDISSDKYMLAMPGLTIKERRSHLCGWMFESREK